MAPSDGRSRGAVRGSAAAPATAITAAPGIR
jgi:hypothetical protein